MGLCYLLEHSIYLLLDLSNPHQRFFKLFMKNHCKIHTKKGETCVGENRDQESILQGLILSNAMTFLTICHTKLCCWCWASNSKWRGRRRRWRWRFNQSQGRNRSKIWHSLPKLPSDQTQALAKQALPVHLPMGQGNVAMDDIIDHNYAISSVWLAQAISISRLLKIS